MEYKKPALSIEEQIFRLKERGLSDSNEETLKRYLSNISYYRLRAYTYPFQNNKIENHPFITPINIEEIMGLYTFDRKLRLFLFDAIERIEIALRTQVIYQWAITQGSHWHLQQKLYKDKGKFIKHLDSLQKEIKRSNETFINHYFQKYNQPIEPPAWMSLEVTSIGLLSLIFQNLKNSAEKKNVTHHFGLFSNEILENWIHNFCNIRNICAHHGRLWNRRIPTHLTIPRKTKFLFIENTKINPYKLYASLVAMVYCMEIINPESKFKSQLLELLSNCPNDRLKEMGFPYDWEKDNFWK